MARGRFIIRGRVGRRARTRARRRRHIYGERREIEHSGSLEHRIAQMSPEQRLARLRELQAKAGLMIDGDASEVEE